VTRHTHAEKKTTLKYVVGCKLSVYPIQDAAKDIFLSSIIVFIDFAFIIQFQYKGYLN